MSPDVFISHASRDHPLAVELKAALEARDIRCWIAPEDIPPGESFPEQLEEAVSHCRILVVLISEEINASRYVRMEVMSANDLAGAKIIPVRLQKQVTLNGALKLYLGSLQWVAAYDVPAAQWQEQLYVRIAQILNGEGEAEDYAAGGRVPDYANYTEALKSTGKWAFLTPLCWWVVAGLVPTSVMVLEHGTDGIFLAKLWPHFFLFPLLIGFVIPLCLTPPVAYLVRKRRLRVGWLVGLVAAALYITYSDVRSGDPALWEYAGLRRLELVQVVEPGSPAPVTRVMLAEMRAERSERIVGRTSVMREAHALIEVCPELNLKGEPLRGESSTDCNARRDRLLAGMLAWRDGPWRQWSATHWAYVASLFAQVFTLGLGITSLALLLRMRLQGVQREPVLNGLLAFVFFGYFLWLPFRIVSLHEKANLFHHIHPLTEAPITMVVVLCYAITIYMTLRPRSLPAVALLSVTGVSLVYVALFYPDWLFYVIGRSSDPLTYPMITIVVLVILIPLLGGGRAAEELSSERR
jgi:hypothetical protein